ncbi:MAG: cytochrome C [Chlorobium sp.]|uniref:c-type cytochrome n=1 Tax=Chlorobium sp. TaxID=1095 RepID=UPI0025C60F6E|nr:cytochrome c peroxidase [Chlorobium sp.]MCF8383555.1 cytochrome C [Chlorobium sp.]
MKLILRRVSAVMLVTASMAFFGSAIAADVPSFAHGKKLFNDPALGGSTNSMSCNSCHPSGKGLEHAWKNPKLAETINVCITGQLTGKALPLDSMEMRSLVLYIRSLKSPVSGY